MNSEFNKSFELPCEICNKNDWSIAYEGLVRDGVPGAYIKDCKIGRCNSCNVERLEENKCLVDKDYNSEGYRDHLGQTPNVNEYQKLHDDLQQNFLSSVLTSDLRGKVICDIGCAGGSLLDHVSGVAGEIIAIEPTINFHEYLLSKKYNVFHTVIDAVPIYEEGVDIVFLIQVLEHVSDPVKFLKEIKVLLKNKGKLILTTPNRNDVLMKIYPEVFKPFFYRRAHRWYFDEISLEVCLRNAGFENNEIKFNHRQSLSNALNWLKESAPKGNNQIEVVTENMDMIWRLELERTKSADTLVANIVK